MQETNWAILENYWWYYGRRYRIPYQKDRFFTAHNGFLWRWYATHFIKSKKYLIISILNLQRQLFASSFCSLPCSELWICEQQVPIIMSLSSPANFQQFLHNFEDKDLEHPGNEQLQSNKFSDMLSVFFIDWLIDLFI